MSFRGINASAAIRLHSAHIGGQLSMTGATLDGADFDGNCLVADNLQADTDVYLDDGFTAAGAIRLAGAHIHGQFAMPGSTLNGVDTDGSSLIVDGLQAESDMLSMKASRRPVPSRCVELMLGTSLLPTTATRCRGWVMRRGGGSKTCTE